MELIVSVVETFIYGGALVLAVYLAAGNRERLAKIEVRLEAIESAVKENTNRTNRIEQKIDDFIASQAAVSHRSWPGE